MHLQILAVNSQELRGNLRRANPIDHCILWVELRRYSKAAIFNRVLPILTTTRTPPFHRCALIHFYSGTRPGVRDLALEERR
jgi:hypothetical protein